MRVESDRFALGVSISGYGVVAALVRAPGTVIGLYRASPQFLKFLGLSRVLQDAAAQLRSQEGTPICLSPSPESVDGASEQLDIAERLSRSLAGRVDVVRPCDLTSSELVADRRVGRAIDESTDAVALAAASYALARVAEQPHSRIGRGTTVVAPHRRSDGWQSDNRDSENRDSENRQSDNRNSDNRNSENRQSDTRHADDWSTVTVRARRSRSASPPSDVVETEAVIDLRANATSPVANDHIAATTSQTATDPPQTAAVSPRMVVAACYWLTTLVDGAARIILPLYLLELGVSASGVGLAFLASEAFGLLATIGAGVMLRRAGYRRAFLASIVLHLIASLGYLFVFPGLGWIVLAWVSALRACRGLAKELIKTASTAYFKHLPSPGRTGKKTQVQLLLGGKDGVKGLGFFLGGVLLHLFGATWSFVLLGSVTAASLAAAVVAVPDHREDDAVAIELGGLKVGLVWLGFARAFLYASRDIWMVVPVPLYLAQQGNSDIAIGGLLAIGLVLLGGSQPAMASMVRRSVSIGSLRVKRRWRFRPMVALMPIVAAVVPAALLLIGVDGPGWVLALGVLAFSVLMGIATVPHNRLHVGLARDNHTSLDLTIYKSVAQVGKVVSVAASGVIFAVFGLEGCLVASLIALAGATACGVQVVAARSKTIDSQRPDASPTSQSTSSAAAV